MEWQREREERWAVQNGKEREHGERKREVEREIGRASCRERVSSPV